MIKIQFKAKSKNGFFKFPIIKKEHIIDSTKCRVMSYSNSEMFIDVLNNYLRKELKFPVGLSCNVNNLSDDLGISVIDGFLNTYTFTVGGE